MRQQGSRKAGSTFPSIILRECRDLKKRKRWFEAVFDVPEQTKTKFKKLMVKFSNEVVEWVVSCWLNLLVSQRITSIRYADLSIVFINRLETTFRRTIHILGWTAFKQRVGVMVTGENLSFEKPRKRRIMLGKVLPALGKPEEIILGKPVDWG